MAPLAQQMSYTAMRLGDRCQVSGAWDKAPPKVPRPKLLKYKDVNHFKKIEIRSKDATG